MNLTSNPDSEVSVSSKNGSVQFMIPVKNAVNVGSILSVNIVGNQQKMMDKVLSSTM
jgi:hypothetical protein